MSRVTHSAVEDRVRIVYELILTGTLRHDIVKYGREKWDAAPRTIDRYISRAREKIKEVAAEIQRDALETHLAQRALLRNKAHQAGDLRLVSQILRDEAEMLSLYIQRHEIHTIDVSDIDPSDLTESQLDELTRRAQAAGTIKTVSLPKELDWDA